LSKNITISIFEKVSKSSHFRSDNQRQISLDLSHTCKIRKRLISLINFATFLKIIRLARCEYSKLVSVYSFSKESVLVFEEECAYNRRKMCLYSKRCVRITTQILFIRSAFRNKTFVKNASNFDFDVLFNRRFANEKRCLIVFSSSCDNKCLFNMRT
jgi:hypothetical protein